MGFKKETGRGRLDKWYKLAKEKGYRARAAFKLIQLNKKYHVLEKSKVLLDLCAAPGSWCQVASEVMPPNSIIIGVDLAPIKPIPRCITFQGDITADKCRATIRKHLKSWKVDTVLHDGAPNVGTAWVQDAFSQAELVLQSLKLATDFLAPGGTFITKIFRSKDYNSLVWVFKQLFAKVEATKPPSSRNVSAEIFVVCRDFKAPKRIDPRFLDPASVFAELVDAPPNNEAKVFNPQIKKRKREGYEEGDYTQFKEAPASDFIQAKDPIDMLGSLNKLSFKQKHNGDLALATLDRMPETTTEIRSCCADLKVLGRSDFKLLLRWRLKIREKFGMSTKQRPIVDIVAGDEVAKIEPMDEEMKMQEEMQRLKDEANSKKKKERRKENERKQKKIVRMQMNMTDPTEIGLERGEPYGEDSVFALERVRRAGALEKFANGKMHSVVSKPEDLQPSSSVDEFEDDEEGDNLEGQLDAMYEQFQERKEEVDAKYKAKRARKEHDDEFEGFSDNEVSSEDEIIENEDDEKSDFSHSDDGETPLFDHTIKAIRFPGHLSKRAAVFFDGEIFKAIDGLDHGAAHSDSGVDLEDDWGEEPRTERRHAATKPEYSSRATKSNGKQSKTSSASFDGSDLKDDSGFEIIKRKAGPPDELEPEPVKKDGRSNVDIITAEAMTLAHNIVTGSQTRSSLIDEGFNKYSLRDVEGLPAWFLDDENAHSRPQKPISAAAAAAIKEKSRALNARPIKKVREAKARKKFKAAQKLEKLKRKSALLIEDEDMSERDKATAIQQMMAKAGKKKPKEKVKLVVARGSNRGINGRPRGTRGKYKMVDPRMKKEKRAEKRLAKRRK